MRRVRFLATLGSFALVVGSLVVGTSAVSAAPTPDPTATVAVPAAQKPTTVCNIGAGGTGAVHMTGLGVTKGGYVVIDGANTDWPQLRIVYLDSGCKRTAIQQYGGAGGNDPQDLAVDSSGVIWIADTGDSSSPPSRSKVAVWKVTSKSSMKLYHISYPGDAENADAMMLNGDGTPIFITKVSNGPAKIYVPSAALSTSSTVPLKQAGTFRPQQTGTGNKFGLAGQNWVTSAATSPDGKKAVIRTYSDAYEWDVTKGDVVGAITKGTPRITPLPDDAQGEAITYSADSSSFLTVSNTSDATPILKWKPSAPVKSSAGKGVLAAGGTSSGGIMGWLKDLSLNQLMLLLGGIGLLGLILIVIGVLGITRSRKVAREAAARERAAAARAGQARNPAAVRPDGAAGGVYGAARSGFGSDPYADPYGAPDPRDVGPPGGAYQGGQYSGGQHGGQYGGGQYGGGPPLGQPSGAPYGGGQYGDGEYGGGEYGGGQNPPAYGRPADPYADDPDPRRRPRSDGR